jgi:hypothetical protein
MSILLSFLSLFSCKTKNIIDTLSKNDSPKSSNYYSIKNEIEESKLIHINKEGFYEIRKTSYTNAPLYERDEWRVNKNDKLEIILLDWIGMPFDTLRIIKKKCFLSKTTNDIYCPIKYLPNVGKRKLDSLRAKNMTIDSLFHRQSVIIDYYGPKQ